MMNKCTECKHYLEKTCVPGGYSCDFEPQAIYFGLKDHYKNKAVVLQQRISRAIEYIENNCSIVNEEKLKAILGGKE